MVTYLTFALIVLSFSLAQLILRVNDLTIRLKQLEKQHDPT